jgi:hypothetical protein
MSLLLYLSHRLKPITDKSVSASGYGFDVQEREVPTINAIYVDNAKDIRMVIRAEVLRKERGVSFRNRLENKNKIQEQTR